MRYHQWNLKDKMYPAIPFREFQKYQGQHHTDNDGKRCGQQRNIKRQLARKLVEMYHSPEAAQSAEAEFDKIFINKGIPDEIPEKIFDNGQKIGIIDLIVSVNFAPSNGEARRLVQQGGVSIDGEKIADVKAEITIDSEKVLKVGKRKFIKLVVK